MKGGNISLSLPRTRNDRITRDSDGLFVDIRIRRMSARRAYVRTGEMSIKGMCGRSHNSSRLESSGTTTLHTLFNLLTENLTLLQQKSIQYGADRLPRSCRRGRRCRRFRLRPSLRARNCSLRLCPQQQHLGYELFPMTSRL